MKNLAVPLAAPPPAAPIRTMRIVSRPRVGTACLALVARYLCWATRNNR